MGSREALRIGSFKWVQGTPGAPGCVILIVFPGAPPGPLVPPWGPLEPQGGRKTRKVKVGKPGTSKFRFQKNCSPGFQSCQTRNFKVPGFGTRNFEVPGFPGSRGRGRTRNFKVPGSGSGGRGGTQNFKVLGSGSEAVGEPGTLKFRVLAQEAAMPTWVAETNCEAQTEALEAPEAQSKALEATKAQSEALEAPKAQSKDVGG